MNILIVGIDSLVGKQLRKKLLSKGKRVYGTSRKKNLKANEIYLDLATNKNSWQNLPEQIDVAFIASGITNTGFCETNKSFTKFINLYQTSSLIDRLTSSGIHVIFPSTNLVLDCKTPKQKIDAEYNPIGFYAECKADIEKKNRKRPSVTIVRLPKILDENSGILKTWLQNIRDGESIEAFTDLFVSPISIDYACLFLEKAIEKRPGGIWHLSGDEELSYATLAHQFLEYLGAKHNVNSRNIPSTLIKDIPMPEHPSLDCSVTEKVFGIGPQNVNNMMQSFSQKNFMYLNDK